MKTAYALNAVFLGAMAIVGATAVAGEGPDSPPDDVRFGMFTPVACREIRNFEDYDVLPLAALTADDKLLVYVRPRYYKSTRDGQKNVAHVSQDGKIRRKGEKAVVWTKTNVVDYEVKTEEPLGPIYLKNTISLKGLKPGEYEYEIVLHDRIGQSRPAVATLPFRVILPIMGDGPAPFSEGPGRR